jgi:hypothetical protein
MFAVASRDVFEKFFMKVAVCLVYAPLTSLLLI